MKVTRFHAGNTLLLITGMVHGARSSRLITFLLDTGCQETVVSASLLDSLGYNPRQGEAIASMRSAVAVEQGYLIRIAKITALGHSFANFRVHAQDLPDGYGIDGLLGLSFLQHFDLRDSVG